VICSRPDIAAVCLRTAPLLITPTTPQTPAKPANVDTDRKRLPCLHFGRCPPACAMYTFLYAAVFQTLASVHIFNLLQPSRPRRPPTFRPSVSTCKSMLLQTLVFQSFAAARPPALFDCGHRSRPVNQRFANACISTICSRPDHADRPTADAVLICKSTLCISLSFSHLQPPVIRLRTSLQPEYQHFATA
jgi:hypothetical protein